MPRTDLAARPATAFPRVRPDSDSPTGLDYGNAHEATGAHPSGQAAVLRLKATYRADGTAQVKLAAFTT
ncbi:hypothetical protein [Streptomyces sp. CBMA123]|uniref:hypothetical protein n=1 Tax=Streptomyces sp. CBMA123 TaxID=1896313 RepID=UPI001661EFD3|nr:hypothetical protein [Streptomyces sp. CBMA123]MBD0695717.1 hypothetical protein [Streptomyces sp. CBMA123]